jgi:DNA-binding beta-propeller fold protein YncE
MSIKIFFAVIIASILIFATTLSACGNRESIASSPEVKVSNSLKNISPAIYISNSLNGTLYKYDWDTLNLISQINTISQIEAKPSALRMALDKEGKNLYAINNSNNTLISVNTQSFLIEHTIELQDQPSDIVYLSDTPELCVSLPHLKEIQFWDVKTFNLTDTVKFENFPGRLISSPNGKSIFVLTSTKKDEPYDLFLVLNSKNGSILGEVRLIKDWHEIAVTQNGELAYLSNRASCSISVINTKTLQIIKTFSNITKREFPDATIGNLAISLKGDILYFCDNQSNYIRSIASKSGKLVNELEVTPRVNNLYLSNHGMYLIAVDWGGIGIDSPGKIPGSISIIDISSWKIINVKSLDTGVNMVLASPSL